MDAARRPLVIGYGNTLRRDDGVGRYLADRLARDPRAAGVRVLAAHQLLPEHALDLHEASVAVLVDALVEGSTSAGSLSTGSRAAEGGSAASPSPSPSAASSASASPSPPGSHRVRRVDLAATPASGVGASRVAIGSHHCTPETLVVMARGLYGTVPPVTVVGVRVVDTGEGEGLTPPVLRSLPDVVDAVLDLLAVPGAEEGIARPETGLPQEGLPQEEHPFPGISVHRPPR